MSFALHQLRPAAGSRKREKRVGRGNASGHGTYSTRGIKGQRARSGGRKGQRRRGMKRILLALPKLGGFKTGRPRNRVITLDDLSRVFKPGSVVSAEELKKHGFAAERHGAIKILGSGTLSHALTVKGVSVSAAAREKIAAAGGSVV